MEGNDTTQVASNALFVSQVHVTRAFNSQSHLDEVV